MANLFLLLILRSYCRKVRWDFCTTFLLPKEFVQRTRTCLFGFSVILLLESTLISERQFLSPTQQPTLSYIKISLYSLRSNGIVNYKNLKKHAPSAQPCTSHYQIGNDPNLPYLGPQFGQDSKHMQTNAIVKKYHVGARARLCDTKVITLWLSWEGKASCSSSEGLVEKEQCGRESRGKGFK